MKSQSRHQVHAWQFQDVLLESYDYAPGKAEASEPHIHSDYQVCLSLDFPGVYRYRGVHHPVPQGSLSVLHPGEKHSASDPEDRLTHAFYRLFYLPSRLLQQTISWSDAGASFPFFPDPVLLDASLFSGFLYLHRTIGGKTPLLEQETLLQSLLVGLMRRYATDLRRPPAIRPDQGTVRRVKAYIEDNHHRDIALSDLAQLVQRHPVYLNTLFRRSVGVPPHAYQTNIRIDRARRLLADGMPAGEAAQQVGFYDQSHFGRHFRRYTGVTPARYRTLIP